MIDQVEGITALLKQKLPRLQDITLLGSFHNKTACVLSDADYSCHMDCAIGDREESHALNREIRDYIQQ